jgi:hypothetical protein
MLNLSWLPPPILTQPSRSGRAMTLQVLVSDRRHGIPPPEWGIIVRIECQGVSWGFRRS